MTTPSGQISLSDVNVELGCAVNACISMNNAVVRTLAGVGGAGTIIRMNDLRGKSDRVAYSLAVSASTNNYDLYANRGPQYSAGKTDITLTVCPGVCVGSTSTGTAAFLVPSSFNPGDTICIINCGIIVGKGGTGGIGGKGDTRKFCFGDECFGPQNGGAQGGTSGSPAGGALGVCRAITLNNSSGTINGGGGGGGGGGAHGSVGPSVSNLYPYDCITNIGPIFCTGSLYQGGGGGGGFGCGIAGGQNPVVGSPVGTPGTCTTAGSGGCAECSPFSGTWGTYTACSGVGGAGGAAGSNGCSGENAKWNAPSPPGAERTGGSGGSAGFAVAGNPNVTYSGPTGTRNGPIS